MPRFSERAYALPASPIRKLVPYAEAAKARGVHVYHLNIGQPDIETPPEFFHAIQAADVKVLAYSHSAGILPLREQLVAYYGRCGHALSIDNVMVTTGTLCHGCSPELAREHDQCLIEHTSLFQVRNQSRSTLIHQLRSVCHASFYSAMVIPSAMVELNEADATFGQSSSQQAVGGE